MIPLWAHLPGIPASGSGCPARHRMAHGKTGLGVKGSLCRGPHRRALDSCAPFCSPRSSRRAAPPGTRCNPISSSYADEGRWK